MRRKHLESLLCSSIQQIEFIKPKIQLEQYITPISLATDILLLALQNHDIGPGKTVLDLGCGTGILTIGTLLCQTDIIYAIDCDINALSITKQNINYAIQKQQQHQQDNVNPLGIVSLILAQVKPVNLQNNITNTKTTQKNIKKNHFKYKGKGNNGQQRMKNQKQNHQNQNNQNYNYSSSSSSSSLLSSSQEVRNQIIMDDDYDDGIPLPNQIVDTVITNPPFGTKACNAGIDLRFLKTAIRLAKYCVYSFHKTSTREFICHYVTNVLGGGCKKSKNKNKISHNNGNENNGGRSGNGEQQEQQEHADDNCAADDDNDNQQEEEEEEEEIELSVTVVAEMKFSINNTYQFHKQSNVLIDVDLLRIEIKRQPIK